jgi:hypothetical protein
MIEDITDVKQHLREFGSARSCGDVLVQELLQLDLGYFNDRAITKLATDQHRFDQAFRRSRCVRTQPGSATTRYSRAIWAKVAAVSGGV